MKQAIWVGMFVGSAVGGLVPEIWGADAFSFSSILLGAAGGVLGIFLAYKLTR